jgi:two-component system, LuxR family, sensor kinase FixL
LMVVVEPDWAEVEGTIELDLEGDLPPVLAEPHGLLQIFLNLSQNSCRALSGVAERRLRISASTGDGQVTVHFEDTGPGVQDQSLLFQPFRPEADGSGLGLYVSRALARSFGGDLVFVPTSAGCRFDVILQSGAPRA